MRSYWLAVGLFIFFSTTSCKELGILEKLDNYTIVYPKQYEDKTRRTRSINTVSREDPSAHLDQVSFHVQLNETTNFILDLELNTQLLTDRYHKSVLIGNETVKTETPDDKNVRHCNYHGNVRGTDDSHVRLKTCNGVISGYITLPSDFLYINPLDGEDGAHVVYRSSDLRREQRGVEDEIRFDTDTSIGSDQLISEDLVRADNVRKKKNYFVVLGVVVHSSVSNRLGSNKEIEEHVTALVNEADGFYIPVNLRVVLTHIEIWKDTSPIQISVNSTVTLEDFTVYSRRQRMDRKNAGSFWTYADSIILLCGGEFAGDVLGKAWIDTICLYSPFAVVQDTALDLVLTSTFVHELGHNLGLNHYTAGCQCAHKYCIMGSTLYRSSPGTTWSSCSKRVIFEHMRDNKYHCLETKPDKSRVLRPKCGNEIVDYGEECDCGSPETCTSKCCDPQTCKLVEKAECDGEQSCCSPQCKFQQRDFQCRPAAQDCDLPEYCTGKSDTCPNKDLYKQNGNNCTGGLCQDGACVSRNRQCKKLFGPGAYESAERENCYDRLQNYRMSPCGRWSSSHYRNCEKKDWKCGSILCSGTKKQHCCFNGYVTAPFGGEGCFMAMASDFTTGLVADGIECGERKVCVDQKCVENLAPKCSEKCSQRGVCNNEGNCHCDPGWAPPYCLQPGHGGSQIEATTDYVPIVVGILIPLLVLAIVCGLCFRFGGRKKVMQTLSERFKQSNTDASTKLGTKHGVKGAVISRPAETTISLPVRSNGPPPRQTLRAPPTKEAPLPPKRNAAIPPNLPVSVNPIQRAKPVLCVPPQRKAMVPPTFKMEAKSTTRKFPARKPVHRPPPLPTSKPDCPGGVSVKDLKKRFDAA